MIMLFKYHYTNDNYVKFLLLCLSRSSIHINGRHLLNAGFWTISLHFNHFDLSFSDSSVTNYCYISKWKRGRLLILLRNRKPNKTRKLNNEYPQNVIFPIPGSLASNFQQSSNLFLIQPFCITLPLNNFACLAKQEEHSIPLFFLWEKQM